MWGSALLGQELDIYQNLVVSKWTWTEEVLAIFLTPPPPLPENPVYVHQSDHCPRPVINIKKIYRYKIQIYLFLNNTG